MPLNIATNVPFKDENEGGDAVDSNANGNNGGTADAVETKVINGHAKQEATDDVTLPPTAKYSEIWILLIAILNKEALLGPPTNQHQCHPQASTISE